jgi:hypothetical protein
MAEDAAQIWVSPLKKYMFANEFLVYLKGSLPQLCKKSSVTFEAQFRSNWARMRPLIIEDIDDDEKKHLTIEDLLSKFENIRKLEKLTPELIESFKNHYR